MTLHSELLAVSCIAASVMTFTPRVRRFRDAPPGGQDYIPMQGAYEQQAAMYGQVGTRGREGNGQGRAGKGVAEQGQAAPGRSHRWDTDSGTAPEAPTCPKRLRRRGQGVRGHASYVNRAEGARRAR